jgi:hypothetical protein
MEWAESLCGNLSPCLPLVLNILENRFFNIVKKSKEHRALPRDNADNFV